MKRENKLNLWSRLKEFINMWDDLSYHLCKTQTSDKYE